MARSRTNPRGLPVNLREHVPSGYTGPVIVRVGKGERTHLYDPEGKIHACRSGLNAGRGGPSGAVPTVERADDARQISCYRCIKLALMNLKESGGESVLPRSR